MIRPAVLALLLFLPACAATAEGEWPSLARRPGETQSAATVMAAAAPTTVPAADAGAVTVAASRVATIARDFDNLMTNWRRQRGDTEAAVTAARGAAASSAPWARAQLELTRLERLGSEMADLRTQADTVAGDLAVAGSSGAEVKPALDRAGQLIARIEAARAEHGRVFEAAQKAVAR